MLFSDDGRTPISGRQPKNWSSLWRYTECVIGCGVVGQKYMHGFEFYRPMCLHRIVHQLQVFLLFPSHRLSPPAYALCRLAPSGMGCLLLHLASPESPRWGGMGGYLCSQPKNVILFVSWNGALSWTVTSPKLLKDVWSTPRKHSDYNGDCQEVHPECMVTITVTIRDVYYPWNLNWEFLEPKWKFLVEICLAVHFRSWYPITLFQLRIDLSSATSANPKLWLLKLLNAFYACASC